MRLVNGIQVSNVAHYTDAQASNGHDRGEAGTVRYTDKASRHGIC